MAKITKLPEETIPKIAAGEVIENPASVMKELLDNALDAKARFILVEVEDSGFTKLKVMDDGEGMDKEDLSNCFGLHCTSKIKSIEDLTSLRSLGFRGEALASIASVANIKIRSKTLATEFGYELEVVSGVMKELKPIGVPQGTLVEVSDLFSEIPARKKFLKDPQTEYRSLLKVITGYVLGHTDTAFKFSHNGKLVFNFSTTQKLQERVLQLLGQDFAASLLDTTAADTHLALTGFITKPQTTFFNKDANYLFVNGRVVSSNVFSVAVKNAYGKMLESKVYPGFILHLNLSPDLIDVNVHPQKATVAFWNDEEVYDFVYKAIKQTLDQNDLTFTQGYDTDILHTPVGAAPFQYKSLKDSLPTWRPEAPQEEITGPQLFQINKTYIASPTKEGLVLIDQHAAHESILFTEYSKAYANNFNKDARYTPETPFFVELTLVQMATFNEHINVLFDLGFDAEPFGSTAVRINSFPQILKDHNIKQVFSEMLSDLDEHKKVKAMDVKTNQTIAFLACRSAVKAGDILSYEEQKNICTKLENTPDTYTCPHGRPVKILIKNSELARMFKRIR